MTYDLSLQKRISARVLKVGTSRVRFDPARLHDIKQAITKEDIRQLVQDGSIIAIPEQGISRVRARKQAVQRRKGLRKGPGRKEGKATARNPSKKSWMKKIRAQRSFLSELKGKSLLSAAGYRDLYAKSKGGFFRSVRHIKLVMNEKGYVKGDKSE